MAAEQSWWNMPLPAGWEAKYDTGQKRYFFVNHSTRATTWEDPRKAIYQQRQQQQQPSWQQASPYRHSPAAQHESIPMAQMTSQGQSHWQTELEEKYNMKVRILPSEDDEEVDEHRQGHGRHHGDHSQSHLHGNQHHGDYQGHGKGQQRKSHPRQQHQKQSRETSFTQANLQRIKQAFPTAPEDVIRDLLIRTNNSEAKVIASLQQAGYIRQSAASPTPPISQNSVVVNKLKREFPTADAFTIKDILRAVQDNESRARQELKALGFKQSVTASASSLGSQSTSSKASSQRATSPNRAPSPRRSASPQPKSPQKPATPKMTEEQKNRMKEQYCAEYPNCTASVIAMALEAANYDGAKAKMLLQTMSSGNTAAKKAQRSRDSSPQKSSEERTFSSATPSLDSTGQVSASGVAVSFPDTSTPSTSATMFTGSSSFASHTQSTASASTSDYLKADTGVKTTDNASISDYMKKASSPSASPLTKQQKRQTRARTPVGQAARAKSSTYQSSYRTEAKGPNPSLAQGPNVDLLIDDYVNQHGPNRSIQNGPAFTNRSGPCHYTGRDCSLAQGPNYSICNGPNPDLVQGSMYGSALTRRHVTATAV